MVAVRRANNPSQPNTVTDVRYNSRNTTIRDHGMITGHDADLVEYLRTDGLVVVHSGPDWTFEEVSSTRRQVPLQNSGWVE
ncbi:hypothetical protein [Saccharopolyspora sp. 5N708]|uniref:hypothetical protein n=1 Tax=Saccharopolyspora sp. 5N708 TaxID=3457424 RepID=UPI003FCF9E62